MSEHVLTEMDVHSVPVQEPDLRAMATTVSVTEQLTRTRQMITRKYHANKYIAYFQNYTNTFLPPDRFRSYLMEATRIPGVVEISVSTRPDCVSAEYLDIMRDIRAMTGIQMNVELGLQTANYHTLQMIDRGHGLAEFIDAVLRIKRYTGISICTHVILNLPGRYGSGCKRDCKNPYCAWCGYCETAFALYCQKYTVVRLV